MTYPTFGDDWRKRWVELTGSPTLHRVASTDDENWEADGLIPIGTTGTTACGRSGRLAMPGILSRMVTRRCKRCCKLVGIPSGNGAPYNDETLREQREV